MKIFLTTLFLLMSLTAKAQAQVGGYEVDEDHPELTSVDWSEALTVPGLMTQVLGLKDECKPIIENLALWADAYYREGIYTLRAKQPEDKVWKLLEGMQKIIAKTEKETPQCFQAVALYSALKTQWGNTIYVLALLAKEGKLQPLSQKLRTEMGGTWAETTSGEKNRSTVMGAYDCETSTIFFDPYLPPGDLSASLKHELSHLLRDKMTVTNLNLRENILADEILASLDAALEQINRHDNHFVAYGKKDDQMANFDFTLYSREGELRKMGPDWGPAKRIDLSLHQFFALYAAKDWAAKNLKVAFSKIQKQYFPQRDVDISKFYLRTLQQNDIFKDPFLLLPHETSVYDWGMLTPANDLAKILEPTSYLLKPKTKAFLARLKKSILAPSRQCKAFLEETSKGRLNDYLGAGLRTPMKPGSEGVKPGSEGVKPGTGVRLCISQRIRI